MIATYLQDEGYQVDQATTAAQGLPQIRREVPRVLLLNLRLPDLDGLQFIASYRRDPRPATVPCVVLSGDPQLTQAVRTLDVRAVLAKPGDLDVLHAVIEQASQS